MKNIFLIGCLLGGIAFIFGGCSDKDESPFAGTDNYITAMTLTQGKAVYEAIIAGDSITVTVPYTVSLDGATAVFEHSELAVITPDPASITDWNRERQFRVTSYNQGDRRYIYRVIHADIPNEGDVVLHTQADVEAFAESGATIIRGNLVIGAYVGTDSVTDLSGLTALKEVTGSIIVNNNYWGTDLSGLDHLQRVGSIKIGTAAEPSRAAVLSMVRFPDLKEVTSEFIVNNTNVQWVQVPELVSVGESLLVFSEQLTSLTFPLLQSVGLDLQIRGITEGVAEYGGGIKAIEFPLLQQIGGMLSVTKMAALETVEFPALTTAGGMVLDKARSLQQWSCPVLENCGEIEFSPIIRTVDATPLEQLDLKALKTVAGDLTLSGLGIKDLTGLSALESVSGVLKFELDKFLATWDLVNLKQVGGLMILGNTPSFAPEVLDVSGVDFGYGLFQLGDHQIGTILGPEHFQGDIQWNFSKQVSEIKGFDRVEGNVRLTVGTNGAVTFSFKEITGNLNFTSSRKNSISFPVLREVGENIETGSGSENDVAALSFDALTQVGGCLYVNSNALETFSAPLLKTVGKQLCLYVWRTFWVSDIDLTSLETVGLNGPGKKGEETSELELGIGNIEAFRLPNLAEVRGDIFFDTSMDGAESISLPKLKIVSGTLTIMNIDEDSSYETLTTLTFPALTTVGKIDIQYNGGIRDYTTFGPLFVNNKITEEQWNTSDNGYNPTWQDMKDGKYTE